MAEARTNPPAGNSAVFLRAQGLKKGFRMGDSHLIILKHVDLTVRQGEFIAIEGRSGSGKSTLLHILGGLDAPDYGRVEFDGTDLAALAVSAARAQSGNGEREWKHWYAPPIISRLRGFVAPWLPGTLRADRQLARIRNTQFGFVFQFYHLVPEFNVLENTILHSLVEYSVFSYQSRKADLQARAADLLNQLGLGHRLTHRPNQLSGGERQRVAIARALMNQPRILFADEPTGNLDFETGRQIMGVLEKLHQDSGQTIVMVTHDRTIASEADRVLLLRDGRLMGDDERGTPDVKIALGYQ